MTLRRRRSSAGSGRPETLHRGISATSQRRAVRPAMGQSMQQLAGREQQRWQTMARRTKCGSLPARTRCGSESAGAGTCGSENPFYANPSAPELRRLPCPDPDRRRQRPDARPLPRADQHGAGKGQSDAGEAHGGNFADFEAEESKVVSDC